MSFLSNGKKVRNAALAAGCVFVVVWVLFFDSHSVYSRIDMHRDLSRLEDSNVELRARIDDLKGRLARPLTDDEVEKIAREQYGMSLPGDRIHPVVPTR